MTTTELIIMIAAAGFAMHGLCSLAHALLIVPGRWIAERIRWHRSAPDRETVAAMAARIREQLAADAARSPVTQDRQMVEDKAGMWARAQ